MNIEELTLGVEDTVLPFETEVKVLINGIKYSIDYMYREDYLDGKLQLVFVLVNKGNYENITEH